MDLITQGLLGAGIAEAGFSRRLGRKATLVGAGCGLFPDSDVIFGVFGEWTSMLVHRGTMHSLLFLPFAATTVGLLCARKWAKTARERNLWVALCMLAMVTHPLLDTCTTYGTQLFAPLSRHRFAIDAVSIVDPVYSVPLLIVTALAFMARGAIVRTRVAQVVLILTTLYLAYGYTNSQAAIAWFVPQVDAELAGVRALPTLGQSQVFRVIGREAPTGDNPWPRMHAAVYSNVLKAGRGPFVLEPGEAETTKKLLQDWRVQRFAWFADGYVRLVTPRAPGTLILDDFHFGTVAEPDGTGWKARVTLDDNGAVVDVVPERMKGFDPQKEWGALLEMLGLR